MGRSGKRPPQNRFCQVTEVRLAELLNVLTAACKARSSLFDSEIKKLVGRDLINDRQPRCWNNLPGLWSRLTFPSTRRAILFDQLSITSDGEVRINQPNTKDASNAIMHHLYQSSSVFRLPRSTRIRYDMVHPRRRIKAREGCR